MNAGSPARPGEAGPHEEVFHHDGGISEFVDFLAADPAVTDIWRLHGAGKFKETVPVLDEKGHSQLAEVERDCEVDVALRWGIGYDSTVRSFVNIISTPKGGTHQSGFEQALLKTFRKAVETNARKLKAGNDKIEKDDIFAGLTAVLTVRLAEPQFEGQTKEILGTSAVRAIVAKVVEQEITAKLTSANRNDKAQSALLLEKIVSEMKSRISARVHKETQRRKNALETSSMPTKLADCRTDDVGRSELFIVEGDSALGTAKLARSSDFQALLPIRGKILNVQKASVGDMLSNAECAALIQVVGAGSGRTFDISAARYGKVILMTDADVDGAHIRTLLLTLFFRYMRPMIDEGRVFAAVPPLHRVEVINAGQKANEMIYTYSEAELHVLLARLAKEGKRYKEPIQRYKGLGEMDAEQLAETTMDPRHRTLRKVGHRERQAGRGDLRPADGLGRGAAQGLHHCRRRQPGPGAHRRLTRRRRGPAGPAAQPSRPGTISRAVGTASSRTQHGQDRGAQRFRQRRLRREQAADAGRRRAGRAGASGGAGLAGVAVEATPGSPNARRRRGAAGDPLATMAMALIRVALLSVLSATSSASISISELTDSCASRVVGSQGSAWRHAAKAHSSRWWRWLRWAFS